MSNVIKKMNNKWIINKSIINLLIKYLRRCGIHTTIRLGNLLGC